MWVSKIHHTGVQSLFYHTLWSTLIIRKYLDNVKQSSLLQPVRVIATNNQRNRDHGQKIDFAHDLPVWGPGWVADGGQVGFLRYPV